MNRPVRPAALVWLTACALYPGLTFAFQGVYPFINGDFYNQVGQVGPWMDLAIKLGIPVAAISVLKTVIGLLWLAGVPGLWAGEWKAYPLVLLAAVLSLLYPVGPAFMGATALVCLIVFREKAGTVPA